MSMAQIYRCEDQSCGMQCTRDRAAQAGYRYFEWNGQVYEVMDNGSFESTNTDVFELSAALVAA